MIDWINDTFGIDNGVSVPTIISIIVFLTGGIASFIFLKITGYRKRRALRKTVTLLIQEVIKNLKRKKSSRILSPDKFRAKGRMVLTAQDC